MKNILLFIICFFGATRLFAQTPKAIEADLLKSFKKIDYWRPPALYSQDTLRDNDIDSLSEANDSFSDKLQYYTSKFPFTISQKFLSLDTLLGIISSTDGLLRIYCWDTGMGGTQHDYMDIIQYKIGQISKSISVDGSTNKIPEYDVIYTFKRNKKTYYLVFYSAVMDIFDRIEGVQIFTIENDALNDNVKIIKTKTALHSRLECSYVASMDDTGIQYDEKSATLKIPIVLEDGKETGRFIIYKFTGQYFEKIKS